MAKRRLHMNSKDLAFMVEDKADNTGMLRMKRIRKEDARFKGQHIKDVLQVYADRIPLNEIVPAFGKDF